ncbi:MAG: hypothetical protein IKL49_07405, partial [Lachnospiraceae bacterium]|nr:hypothetical protein [Lachnospiraceae bacterium]
MHEKVVSYYARESGILQLWARSLHLESQSRIEMGTGKKGAIPKLYLEARQTLTWKLTEETSRIVLSENVDILTTFLRKEAKQKLPALPLAAQIRAELTAEDAALRENYNAHAREQLLHQAKEEKQRLLEEKQQEAEQKIREGIFSLL